MVVLSYFLIGRVQEDEIKPRPFLLQSFEPRCDRGPDQIIAGLDSQGLEILADELLGRAMMFYEHDFACPAAQRLDPHRTASGVSIEKGRALHSRTEHIKQRLAHLVGGGAKIATL